MRTRVLFHEINAGSAQIAAAFAKRLRFVPVCDDSHLAEELARLELSFERWAPPVPGEPSPSVQARVDEMAGWIRQAASLAASRRAFASSHPGQGERLMRDVVAQVTERAAEPIAMIEAFDEECAREAPRLVVMGNNSTSRQRALASRCAQRGIPCLELAHGLYGGNLGHVAGDHHALHSLYAAWGERARERLVAFGNAPSKIFVTGSPSWDPLYQPENRPSAAEAKARIGLDPSRPALLYCTTYANMQTAFWPAIKERILTITKALLEAIRQAGDVQLVVRQHPSEATAAGRESQEDLEQAYRAWAAGLGVERLVFNSGAMHDAVRACDIVVTTPSTVVVEAMILERPVIMIPRQPGADRFFRAEDGIVVIDDELDLPAEIARLLGAAWAREEIVRAQRRALPAFNFGNDGRAAERVAELLEELCLSADQVVVP